MKLVFRIGVDSMQEFLNVSKVKLSLVASLTMLQLTMTGCTPTPPDSRPVVSLPIYEAGNSDRGEELFEEQCSQCHKLKPGSNKKGPQLIGVYGAPAASLTDYKYSQAMTASKWVWNAETLDTYIKDPVIVMPETRMLSDPIMDSADRHDIIAYLSTLGRDAPKPVKP